MSIFEYDEEKVLKIIGREKYEDGVEDGKILGQKSGITIGEVRKEVDLIANFFHKNCTSEEIAERLDMNASYVQKITGLITTYPNETSIDIAKRMLENSSVKN